MGPMTSILNDVRLDRLPALLMVADEIPAQEKLIRYLESKQFSGITLEADHRLGS
jgi:hypothetical protein